jgi:hypothetical protein
MSLAAAALTGALAVTGFAAPAPAPALSVAAPTRPPVAAAAPGPGLIGSPIDLADQGQFDGYDIAMTPDGTSYVGWISAAANSDRIVHLCIVPAGQLACQGGVRSTPSEGASSAAGLKVLTQAGRVALVWFHDTDNAVDGPNGASIAVSFVQADGNLADAVELGDAPSFGRLLDAEVGPDHQIWTVAVGPAGAGPIEVHDGGISAAVALAAPWADVGFAELAFAGSTPVIAATKYGAITTPVAVASRQDLTWTRFTTVNGTWAVATDVGLTQTSSGLRLVTSTDNSTYHFVVANWTGSGFSGPTPTGDTDNCAPASHDTSTDASGRLADVSVECSQLAVANLPLTSGAAIVRIPTRGTVASGTPQIATTPRGRAIVAWSVLNADNSDRLYLAAVGLSDLTVAKTKGLAAGSVTVTAPVSCLPPIGIGVGVGARAAAGWRVTSRNLTLNGTAFAARVLNGAQLTPGATYTLTGHASFTKGTHHTQASVGLAFRACPLP